ncbi:MAG: insulinase family protein [Novosphingobium sp.]|nr:insulinase family protein [Novosphingobium sp.]
MRRFLQTAALALSACAAQQPAAVSSTPPTQASQQTAPLSDLVAAVDIPYEKFVLDNGLTTLVHTDRKAPIVGVTIYYRVGSKHEPRGRTGFAHLYEHLFFGGSANVPNFDVPLEAAGSTPTNGSTWYDRTNYIETVPTGALDLALYMESDRMGYLLPAVTQDKLDKQRGVVQNEKRQGDNQPYALSEYAIGDELFPVGHPYRHATIGSMADLEAATLEDVRQWFRDNYAPNNVVLSLTGDIDAETARPLVEKWFGDLTAGPEVPKVEATPVTLSAPVTRDMTDQVPVLRVTRNWSGPGLNADDSPALQIGMHILGGLASSRLDNALVRGQQVAVSVSASAQTFEQVSFLQAQMDVKPDVERTVAEAALNKVIADYLAEGPTEDEVRRAVTSVLSSQIGALEEVGGFGGKGATLAEGELYSGDPAKFQKDLAAMAALTPGAIKAAMQKWLSRPVVAVNTIPGERTERGETMGGWGDEETRPAPKPDPRKPAKVLPPAPKREAPPIAPVGDLDFPDVERAKLSNGIPVALARRTAIPKVYLALSFDAGIAADALDTPGTQELMLDMLDEGTTSLNATQIAEAQERLGATIYTGGALDESRVTMSALSANLGPSLALMADIARNPAYEEGEVARVRDKKLAELAQTLASPGARASRELSKLLFGNHPYAQPADGLGSAGTLSSLGPDQLRAAHDKWLRPDLARITVVGDVTMARLLPLLEKAFGDWQAPAAPKPVKPLDAAIPAPNPRIVLIDRPNSPQSVIVAGRVLPLTGRDSGQEALDLANEVLGAGFLSRLNLDLREDKGWSYGVRSGIARPEGPRDLSLVAPVQADRTGDAIRLIMANMKAFPATKPVTDEELQRVTDGNVRSLPNRFESNAAVLGALLTNELLGRPDDYYEKLATRWRAIDDAAIDAAAREYLQPKGLTFVIVGERKIIEPQLKGLGLPVEIAPADAGES